MWLFFNSLKNYCHNWDHFSFTCLNDIARPKLPVTNLRIVGTQKKMWEKLEKNPLYRHQRRTVVWIKHWKKRGLRTIGRYLGVTLLLFVIVVFMLPDVNKQTKKWFWNERMTLTFWPIYVDWLLRHHTWEWCSPCIYIIHGTFLVMHNRPELYITATTSQSLLFVIIYVSLCAVHTNRRRIRNAKTV